MNSKAIKYAVPVVALIIIAILCVAVFPDESGDSFLWKASEAAKESPNHDDVNGTTGSFDSRLEVSPFSTPSPKVPDDAKSSGTSVSTGTTTLAAFILRARKNRNVLIGIFVGFLLLALTAAAVTLAVIFIRSPEGIVPPGVEGGDSGGVDDGKGVITDPADPSSEEGPDWKKLWWTILLACVIVAAIIAAIVYQNRTKFPCYDKPFLLPGDVATDNEFSNFFSIAIAKEWECTTADQSMSDEVKVNWIVPKNWGELRKAIKNNVYCIVLRAREQYRPINGIRNRKDLSKNSIIVKFQSHNPSVYTPKTVYASEAWQAYYIMTDNTYHLIVDENDKVVLGDLSACILNENHNTDYYALDFHSYRFTGELPDNSKLLKGDRSDCLKMFKSKPSNYTNALSDEQLMQIYSGVVKLGRELYEYSNRNINLQDPPLL